jgi:hypothetical protein
MGPGNPFAPERTAAPQMVALTSGMWRSTGCRPRRSRCSFVGSDGAARRASGVPGGRAFYVARPARPDVQLLVRQDAPAKLLDHPKNPEDGTTCIAGVWTVAASNFGLPFYFWRIAQDHGQAPWPVQGRAIWRNEVDETEPLPAAARRCFIDRLEGRIAPARLTLEASYEPLILPLHERTLPRCASFRRFSCGLCPFRDSVHFLRIEL